MATDDGIAAFTKFQVLPLCVVVAVAVVGPRELLSRRLLWVVAGEAEVLYGGRPGIAVQMIVS